ERGSLRRQVHRATTALGDQLSKLWSRPRSSAPPRTQVSPPLDALNDQFHDSYGESRHEARRKVPVFVILGDELITFHRDERTVRSFAPRSFHVIKSVAHAPLAVFATLEPQTTHDVHEWPAERLEAAREQLAQALDRLGADTSQLLERTQGDLRTVLQTCVDFLDRLPARVSPDELTAFARLLGPLLMRITDDATQLQLDALHAHVEEALHTLSKQDRKVLQVVVAGDHQARERSLAMQYFQLRLRERPGVEQRVTYAEGVSDEQGALALVGTRRLDHAIGRAFFQDAYRLQRDILGDAAHARLEHAKLTPIA
ncbi:MAG: hypothetical protein RLZZ450_1846, partial [Pseudomonadota bacterium]